MTSILAVQLEIISLVRKDMEAPRTTQQLAPVSASHRDDLLRQGWADQMILAAGQHGTFQMAVQCCTKGLLLVHSHITVWDVLQWLVRLCAEGR